MKTVLLTLAVGLIFALTAYATELVAPSTAFLVGAMLVFALRVKRALGIGVEIDYLEDRLSDRYDEHYQVGGRGADSETMNDITREIDATNKDRDNLKRRKW